ncbi:MAG: phage/plasmid primase, P4 family [Nitrospirae bacterium]|nr:phage/plasmid primase, P4 family [Nitrospirota bacterium]
MSFNITMAIPTPISANDFVATLHQYCEGVLELRALPSTHRKFLDDHQAINSFLAQYAKQDIYLGVATRRDGKNGKLENCQDLGALFMDLDFKDEPEERARKRLREFSLTPSILIQSGGGLHVYWLLNEPLHLQDQADCQQAMSYLRRLAIHLHGDLAAAEPARILRVPGTTNFKYTPPRPVAIEVFEPSRIYDLTDFDEWLPEESLANSNGTHAGFFTNGNEKIEEGRRNTTLYKRARSLKAQGYSGNEILALLRAFNHERCDTPLGEKVIEDIVSHASTQPNRPDFNSFRSTPDVSLQRIDNAELPVQAEPGAAAQTTNAAGPSVDSTVKDEDCGLTKNLADQIQQDVFFAKDQGCLLYVFKGGVYWPTGEAFVRRQVKQILIATGDAKKWSTHRASEVVEFLRVDAPELWECPPLDTINVLNGLLDWKTGELREHDANHLTSVQIPVRYDAKATCPNWDRFVESVFPSDCHVLAYEIIGWLMIPNMSLQIAILLIGEGANGKSVFLLAVRTFLGRENVASVALHRLESDKFAVARLVGKLANICPDLPSEHLKSTSVFKAIVGGDPLLGERKFQGSFEFLPFCRLGFSTNHYPQSKDSSPAFFRRWVVIPFERIFSPSEKISRDVLDAQLADPAEQSGVLNRAIEALRAMQTRRAFTQTDTTRAAALEFRATTDPFAIWLDRHTEQAPDAMVSKRDLRIAYAAYTNNQGYPSISDKAFAQAFSRLRPNIGDGQRTLQGKFQYAYLGLRLLGTTPGSSQDSQDSHLSSQIRTNNERVKREEGELKELTRENPVNAVNAVNLLEEAVHPIPVGTRIRFNGGLGRVEIGTIEEHTTWNQYPDQICYRVNGRIFPPQKVLEIVSDS